MSKLTETEADRTDWVSVYVERKEKRTEDWKKYMPTINALAMVTQITSDHFRLALPIIGFCDFYVRADKLKDDANGFTRMNGFKIILKSLNLYQFEGVIKNKDL